MPMSTSHFRELAGSVTLPLLGLGVSTLSQTDRTPTLMPNPGRPFDPDRHDHSHCTTSSSQFGTSRHSTRQPPAQSLPAGSCSEPTCDRFRAAYSLGSFSGLVDCRLGVCSILLEPSGIGPGPIRPIVARPVHSSLGASTPAHYADSADSSLLNIAEILSAG